MELGGSRPCVDERNLGAPLTGLVRMVFYEDHCLISWLHDQGLALLKKCIDSTSDDMQWL